MNKEELNVLTHFEKLTVLCKHLTNAKELIIYASELYSEILEIRKRLAEIDNEKYFESKRKGR